MSAEKGDWRIDCSYSGLWIFIAVCVAILVMHLFYSG